MSGLETTTTTSSNLEGATVAGQRLIETSFPFIEISKLAKVESYRKNIYRPVYYLHKWWARRSGSVFRAVALGCFLDPTQDLMERFYLPNPTVARGKVVLDPFMGGGTIVGETLRLGAKVVGVDINPVAWFLVKKVVEPVSVSALDEAFRKLEAKVANRILHLYSTRCPECNGSAVASYVYWAKVVKCRLCGFEVPLRKSMVIAPHMSQTDTGLVSCPFCGELFIGQQLKKEITCKSCATEFDPSSGYSDGSKFTCTSCGGTDEIVRVYRAQRSPPEHRLIGFAYVCTKCGKGYKKADKEDHEHYSAVRELFKRLQDGLMFPRGSIPPGYNTDQMRNYNYRYWHEMFNERQLLCLSWLLEAILELEQGNVREFMLLLFSGLLEFNNLFCSPKGLGTGAVRHLFAHHAYIPPKEVLEANPWGVRRSSGGFCTLYRERLRAGKQWAIAPVEHKLTSTGVVKVPIAGEQIVSLTAESFEELCYSEHKRVLLLNKSSASLPEMPPGTVDLVITDPPYFDNVMYSELADFFYNWLQMGLQERYSFFKGPSLEKSEEAIRNLGGNVGSNTYENVLQAVFAECGRVLKDNGLLVFTFHHGGSEAWQAVGKALLGAGFRVQCFYPVHAEMDVGVPIFGKESVKFDAILVCRKGQVCAVDLENEQDVLSEIRCISMPLVALLRREFAVSHKDVKSIGYAAWLMLYTQGRTRINARSLKWGEPAHGP